MLSLQTCSVSHSIAVQCLTNFRSLKVYKHLQLARSRQFRGFVNDKLIRSIDKSGDIEISIKIFMDFRRNCATLKRLLVRRSLIWKSIRGSSNRGQSAAEAREVHTAWRTPIVKLIASNVKIKSNLCFDIPRKLGSGSLCFLRRKCAQTPHNKTSELIDDGANFFGTLGRALGDLFAESVSQALFNARWNKHSYQLHQQHETLSLWAALALRRIGNGWTFR
jgi:hypothetical protein